MASIEPEFESAWPKPTTPDKQYLDAAIRRGDLDGARSIVKSFTPEIRQKLTEDSSLMLTALKENKPEFIRLLVEECNADLEKSVKNPIWDVFFSDEFITPLRYAVSFGNSEAAVELLRLGAYVNAVSLNARHTALHGACKRGMLVIVRQLIQHGADLTIRSFCGKTALMYGVDHVDVCRELIDRGADVNATDNFGNTVLHAAARKNAEVVKLLLENGADLFKKNDDGEDALCIACRPTHRSTDIVKVMRDQLPDGDVGHQDLIRSHQLLGACYVDYHNPLSRYSRVDEALVEWETVIRLREERRHVISGEYDVALTPNPAYDNAVEVDSMLKFEEMRQDANKIYMQGLLLKEKILGPASRETIESVRRLGVFYIASEDYGRGLRLLRHSFNLIRDHSSDSSPISVFFGVFGICVCYISASSKQAINNTVDFKDVYEFLQDIAEEARRSVESTTEDSSRTESDLNERFMQTTLLMIKFFILLETNEVNIVRFRRLVQDFVRLNLRSSEGETVLMNAISPGNFHWFSVDVHAIKLLLECGADTWETDYYGNSVLHLLKTSEECVSRATGNVPSKEAKKEAEMLLAFGAHFDARNKEGVTAVQYLSSLGFDISTHVTLQCLAAQATRRYKIPYEGILPKSLHDFVQVH